ncbi:MAG: hypothetical protein FJ098_07695 [Deltaproteobacteria bacterium]|nr:hypothetical protein [Deltaproteobacteria bacterium]
MTTWRALVILVVPGLLSCGGGGSGGTGDAAPDTTADRVAADAAPEARLPDAAPDTVPPDTAADAGPEIVEWTPPDLSLPVVAGAARTLITPEFEPYTDSNGDGHWEPGEPFEDLDGDGTLTSLELGGFGWRHPTGVHDDLWCRAAALRVQGEWLLLIAVDSLGLGIQRVEGIQERIVTRLGAPSDLPRERIVVAATHSHAVPDSIGIFGEEGVDPDYLAWVQDRAAEAAIQALLAAEEAELVITSADAPELVRDIDPPDITDPYVGIVQARRPGGQAIVTLISVANHPECTWTDNTLISADFPFYLLDAVEAAQGGIGLYVSADLGLMQSPEKLGEEGFERTELVGTAYAEHVLAALAEAEPSDPGDLAPAFGYVAVQAALENPELYIGLAEGIVDGYKGSIYLTGEPPCDFFGCLDLPLAAWRLGDELTLVTLPGEFTPELIIGGITSPPGYGGLYPDAPPEPVLADHLSTRERFVIGLAGMEAGYVYPKMTHEPEEHFSQSHAPGPNMAMALMTGLTELVDDLNAR